ncbi:SDR family oxidoreductase [Pseudoduganella violacea]|nr:SDR family oxidoreductase [Pseudoduganella violacea]
MVVLLTGATGFIGAHLAQALLDKGHRVLAAGRRACSDPRIGFIAADFAHDTEKAVWAARLKGIDAVINTVGIFREHGAQRFAALHRDAPCALFAACADEGVALVLHVSALGADAGAQSAYHRSKKAGDDCLARLPLRACILQPSLVYGADGASARQFRMLATLPCAVRFGTAAQLVQPVHIDDVAAAVCALLELPPAQEVPPRLALAGPQPMPFPAYLAQLRQAMGLGRQPVLRLPTPLAHALARGAALLPGSLLDPEALRMLERGNCADPAPLACLLGRPPRPVRSFIAQPYQARRDAQLDWLLPLLRLSLALLWIWTAIVSAWLYPAAASYALLERSGVPAALAPLLLYGAAALDLLFGLACLALPRRWRPRLWLAQAGLIVFYSLVILLRLPEFLFHPYGPLSKNLPILALLVLLYQLEKK